ncbi:MAG: DUF445 domain-containing protein [Pyrinomonadaceae bacterium]
MEFLQQFQPLLGDIRFQLFSLVFIATIHGYFGAWLAVRMLFRPRYPVKILGITVFPQGMIPRHRERLAKAIGKAVGEELVSRETVLEELFEKDFLRKKIQALVANYTNSLLNEDIVSLFETLPESLRSPINDSLEMVGTRISNYIFESLKTDSTLQSIELFVGKRLDEVFAKSLDTTISEAEFQEFSETIQLRLKKGLNDPFFESEIRKFVGARVDDLADTNQTLGDIFTPEAVQLIKEKAVDQIQPIAQQLSELATEERTKLQISNLIKKEVHTFYEALPFVKKIFVSRENLLKDVDELVDESLPKRLEETLQGDFFAEESKRFVIKAIDKNLERPLPEIVEQISPQQLAGLKNQISNALLSLLKSEKMQKAIKTVLTQTFDKIKRMPLGELIENTYPNASISLKRSLSKAIRNLLTNSSSFEMLNGLVIQQLRNLLHTPVGNISNFVSKTQVNNLANSFTATLISTAQAKLPEVIEEFDIGKVVREKVNNYPVEKLESLVMSVAKEHLRTIELFGALFGFLIGIAQAIQYYFFHFLK